MILAEFDDDLFEEEFLDDISFNQGTAKDIVLSSADWTVETIMKQISQGRINLNPDFQRRDAWAFKKKSSFIESLILNLPIPQIVLAEDKEHKGRFIVIDGKQRLLTIMQFFGHKHYEQFRLEKLEILKQFNGKTIDDIKMDLNLGDYVDVLLNSPIRTLVIKNWKEDNLLYNIFYRLNANTAPLSPQELRTALFPGKFVKFADDFTSDNRYTRRIFKGNGPDFRMRDVELFIRFVSFNTRIDSYRGNIKLFLDETCKIFNRKFDENTNISHEIASKFNFSCETSYNVFREFTFHKFSGNKFESNFNKAVFDIITYYFTDENIARKSLEAKMEVVDAFASLSKLDNKFLASIERTTKSIEYTQYRFEKWGNKLSEIIGCNIPIPNVGNRR